MTLEGLDNNFKFDCCSDSEKVTIKVVNRGGQNSGFRGEHIDLIETEVLAIASVSGYEGQLNDVLADRQIRDSELLQDFYKLTLSDAFFAEPGSALCPTNCKGKSFIARNNYIGNNRARGISTKAENGIMGSEQRKGQSTQIHKTVDSCICWKGVELNGTQSSH